MTTYLVLLVCGPEVISDIVLDSKAGGMRSSIRQFKLSLLHS